MIQTAFLLGLLGSFHCIAMCGPIAIAVHSVNYKKGVLNSIAYSIGRILTYILLGFLFFNIGFLASLIGFQNILSIVLGSIILTGVLLSFLSKKTDNKRLNKLQIKLTSYIRKPFHLLMVKKGFGSKLILGLINGLLPCGLVYVALAVSVIQPSYKLAGFYMMLFGLGTIPGMIIIAHFGSVIGQRKRLKISKLIPIFSIIMATMLIFRGMALGIPYLSPDVKIINNKPNSSCCQHHTKCSPAENE